MKILIVTPFPKESTRGNRVTAQRWADILQEMGHQVTVCERFDTAGEDSNKNMDLLIALHATRSALSIEKFHSLCPGKPILVCLTGTDLHADLQGKRGQQVFDTSTASLDLATQIILLEPEGAKELPQAIQNKLVTIFQSAVPVPASDIQTSLDDAFDVTVIGHLRFEKDPFRTALAARQLPQDSKIRILHIGGALSEEMANQAEEEMQINPRYRWLGELDHSQTQFRLTQSHLTVLSSRSEGAPSVLSEAIVNDVPILATRIPAAIGMLGKGYPGLFEVMDTDHLLQLLIRAETDSSFYQTLEMATFDRKNIFTHQAESNAWKSLIDSLPH